MQSIQNSATRLNLSLCFWCAFLVAGHALYLNAPFVNFEYAFSEATHALTDPTYTQGLDRYWFSQANPLGYSAVAALIMKTLHLDNSFWACRLPSLMAGMAILFAGWILVREIGASSAKLFNLWAAVTTLNPLVWVYTGRATADVLPTGLMCLAFALCYVAKGRTKFHVAAGLLFTLAILVKFNAILLGCGFVYLTFSARETAGKSLAKRSLPLLCYTALPGAALLTYLTWTYANFGILLVADGPKDTLKPTEYVADFPATLTMYLSFLVTMLGFLALLTPLKIFKTLPRPEALRIMAIAVVSAGICSWILIYFSNGGEMDYGGLNKVVPEAVFALMRIGCLALAIFLLSGVMHDALCKGDRFAMFLATAMLPYLAISSCFRPTQRYLLLCLPFVLFYLIVRSPVVIQRYTQWCGWLSAAVFAGVSLFGVAYQVAQAGAAENMAQWIEQNGKIKQVSPGDIQPHAGQHFPLRLNPFTPWVVQTKPFSEALHRETVQVFGRVIRTYYLCPVGDGGVEKKWNVRASGLQMCALLAVQATWVYLWLSFWRKRDSMSAFST